MTAFWLLVIVVAVYNSTITDDRKRGRWREKANDPSAHALIGDRVGDLLNLAIAIWQLMVLWGPK